MGIPPGVWRRRSTYKPSQRSKSRCGAADRCGKQAASRWRASSDHPPTPSRPALAACEHLRTALRQERARPRETTPNRAVSPASCRAERRQAAGRCCSGGVGCLGPGPGRRQPRRRFRPQQHTAKPVLLQTPGPRRRTPPVALARSSPSPCMQHHQGPGRSGGRRSCGQQLLGSPASLSPTSRFGYGLSSIDRELGRRHRIRAGSWRSRPPTGRPRRKGGDSKTLRTRAGVASCCNHSRQLDLARAQLTGHPRMIRPMAGEVASRLQAEPGRT